MTWYSARELGWANDQIAVIDQDQGHSGASVSGRDQGHFTFGDGR